MIIRKLSLIFLSMIFMSHGYAQTLKNNKTNDPIDSILIFPAIGVIKCPQGRNVIPNDSLTEIFQKSLKSILPKSSYLKIVYMGKEYDLNDSLKKYFVNTIPRFSNLNEDVFSLIPIGVPFNEMISEIPGRYFGIIFYDGFVNTKIGGQIAGSLALGIATAALTGGMFAVYTIPPGNYLISDLLLIDKEKGCFLYYNRRTQTGSPIEEKNIGRNFKKVFNGYKRKKRNYAFGA